jgi:ligand-binding SRPBCC domain-containing protein
MGIPGEDTGNESAVEAMKVHVFEREQILPVSTEEAWAFFSTPKNLAAITPPDAGFQMLTGSDEPLHDGQILTYRIRLAPLVRVSWVTEIKSVEPGQSFVDEQRFGPFKFWHHRHVFAPVEGGTRILDRVHYAMPFGPIGEIVHALSVRRKLERVFRHRHDVLARRLEK